MEVWDILDEHGIKTGRSIQRGCQLQDGEFILAVHIYIYNSNGEFLVQKRSLRKVSRPGIWDVTGGAVVSGEDSKTAAIREVKEEIGIDLDESDMKIAGRVKMKNTLLDVWFIKADFDIDSCVLQEEEVDAVKLVEPNELISIVFALGYRQDEYKNILIDYIKHNIMGDYNGKI